MPTELFWCEFYLLIICIAKNLTSLNAKKMVRVPTGQGKLEKVREFGWSGKVRENP
jgi:hypothetical protein